MKRKYLVLAKQNITVLLWALKTAFHINPLILIFWLLFSGLLALLPSAALFYNRRAVAALSAFLSSGKGDFAEIAMPIILLGIILTVNDFQIESTEIFCIWKCMTDITLECRNI